MSNLLKRIERIENALGEQPSPGQLSPVLKEAVDRIIKRLEQQINKNELEVKDIDATGK